MIKDVIVVLIILAIIGAAIAYIVRAKKKGAKCIGCPASGCCSMSKAERLKENEFAESPENEGCGCCSAK